jgi:hypothetical protein
MDEPLNDLAKMIEDELVGEAEPLLKVVHDYEILCLHGSSRWERAEGREANDRLINVCFEIGVRRLAEQFKEIIAQHRVAYEANLKEVKGSDQIEENEKATGKLSWWNV